MFYMSLCVFFICFYLIVCCLSVMWALLPEINVMMMIASRHVGADVDNSGLRMTS